MQLKKMNRMELVNLLLRLTEENEELKKENRELATQLENRRIILAEAGSIAKAALQLNGIFEAAQQAVDDYIASVTHMDEATNKKVDEARAKADEIINDAQKRADELIREAEAVCKNLLEQSKKTYIDKPSG